MHVLRKKPFKCPHCQKLSMFPPPTEKENGLAAIAAVIGVASVSFFDKDKWWIPTILITSTILSGFIMTARNTELLAIENTEQIK